MFKRESSLIVLATVLIGTRASAGAPPDVDVTRFARADRVRIQVNDIAYTGGDTRVVSDPARIHALYVMVASASGKWHRLKFDAPLVHWNIQFEQDGKVLGSYSIGADFLEVYPFVVALTPREQRAAEQLARN